MYKIYCMACIDYNMACIDYNMACIKCNMACTKYFPSKYNRRCCALSGRFRHKDTMYSGTRVPCTMNNTLVAIDCA